MDSIKPFDQAEADARLKAGLKGGNVEVLSGQLPPRKFVDPRYPEEDAKFNAGKVDMPTPMDAWAMRKPGQK